MQNKQLKVFLIILNWNGWKMTLDCLRSIKNIKHYGLDIEIVVVDNGSTDNSVLEIENSNIENSLKIEKPVLSLSKDCKLKIIKNVNNLGFAEGNNVGIRYALKNGADYICLLNNDTRVDSAFLSELIETAESDEKIGLVGGKIYFEKMYEFFKDRYKDDQRGKVIWYAGGLIDWNNVYASHRGVDEVDNGQYDQRGETEYINGCLMLVKKEVFGKAGLFDKRYFLYFEDVDLSLRVRKSGFKTVFCPRAKIWHLNSGSSGSGSGLHDYFITRNRMLFGMKFAPFRSKIALIKESVHLLRSGRQWQKAGVKDFYLRKFGRGSYRLS